jgi:GMP synthase-like glutamine amidotransferase
MLDCQEQGNKISSKVFINFEKVHVILYSYNEEGELRLLLNSKEDKNNSEKHFSMITSEINDMDTSPTIACCRVMTARFFGLFTEANLLKISQGEELNKENLDFYKPDKCETIPWYKLRDTKSFINWIRNMESNPIQFDDVEGEMIYLIEIPLINTENLNKNLAKINYPFEFEYITQENDKKLKLDGETIKILNSFNIDAHIKSSNFEETYVMLSCVPPRDKEVDDAGSFLLFNLFTGLYRRNKERWLYYTAAKNEFPSDEILKSPQCKALIIPGSASNVYNMEPHTINTIAFLKNFMSSSEFNHVKYLGICFGHQIFSEALGGKVMKRPDCFVHAIEEIHINPGFWDLDFMKQNPIQDKRVSYKIKQIHRDDVVTCPSGLQNFAVSDSCTNEVFASSDSRVLTMQGHPEYTPEYFFFRTFKVFIRELSTITDEDEYGQLCNERFEKYVSERKAEIGQIDYEMRAICYHFLKHSYKSEL